MGLSTAAMVNGRVSRGGSITGVYATYKNALKGSGSRGRISRGGSSRRGGSKRTRTTALNSYTSLEFPPTESLYFGTDDKWDPSRLVEGIKKIYFGDNFDIREYARSSWTPLALTDTFPLAQYTSGCYCSSWFSILPFATGLPFGGQRDWQWRSAHGRRCCPLINSLSQPHPRESRRLEIPNRYILARFLQQLSKPPLSRSHWQ